MTDMRNTNGGGARRTLSLAVLCAGLLLFAAVTVLDSRTSARTTTPEPPEPPAAVEPQEPAQGARGHIVAQFRVRSVPRIASKFAQSASVDEKVMVTPSALGRCTFMPASRLFTFRYAS